MTHTWHKTQIVSEQKVKNWKKDHNREKKTREFAYRWKYNSCRKWFWTLTKERQKKSHGYNNDWNSRLQKKRKFKKEKENIHLKLWIGVDNFEFIWIVNEWKKKYDRRIMNSLSYTLYNHSARNHID